MGSSDEGPARTRRRIAEGPEPKELSDWTRGNQDALLRVTVALQGSAFGAGADDSSISSLLARAVSSGVATEAALEVVGSLALSTLPLNLWIASQLDLVRRLVAICAEQAGTTGDIFAASHTALENIASTDEGKDAILEAGLQPLLCSAGRLSERLVAGRLVVEDDLVEDDLDDVLHLLQALFRRVRRRGGVGQVDGADTALQGAKRLWDARCAVPAAAAETPVEDPAVLAELLVMARLLAGTPAPPPVDTDAIDAVLGVSEDKSMFLSTVWEQRAAVLAVAGRERRHRCAVPHADATPGPVMEVHARGRLALISALRGRMGVSAVAGEQGEQMESPLLGPMRGLIKRSRGLPPPPADAMGSLEALGELLGDGCEGLAAIESGVQLGGRLVHGQDITLVRCPPMGGKAGEKELFKPAGQPIFMHEAAEAHGAGFSIAMRAICARDALASSLADAIGSALGLSVAANLYATPAEQQGLPCHVDDHCVLVLQLEGCKQWEVYGADEGQELPRLYSSCTCGGPRTSAPAIFTLSPSDILYVPRGCPHRAVSGSCGSSEHLTLALEAELPMLWEGAVHVALHMWARRIPPPDRCDGASDLRACVALMHAAVHQMGSSKCVELRRSSLVGGLLAMKDSCRDTFAALATRCASNMCARPLSQILILKSSGVVLERKNHACD